MPRINMQPWWFVRLAGVSRWCIVNTVAPESVAEHSYQVAGIALWIHKQFFLQDRVNKGAMLEWALMHDMPEIFTGDIATPMKRKITEQVREISSEFYEPPDENTLLAQIVKIADMAQTIVWLQVNGNRTVHTVNVKKLLRQDYLAKIEEMKKHGNIELWGQLKHLPDAILEEVEW